MLSSLDLLAYMTAKIC